MKITGLVLLTVAVCAGVFAIVVNMVAVTHAENASAGHLTTLALPIASVGLISLIGGTAALARVRRRRGRRKPGSTTNTGHR